MGRAIEKVSQLGKFAITDVDHEVDRCCYNVILIHNIFKFIA